MRFATCRADPYRQTDRQTHRLFSKITFFAFLYPKTLKSGKISNLNFCTITILLLEKNFSGRSNKMGEGNFFSESIFWDFLSFFWFWQLEFWLRLLNLWSLNWVWTKSAENFWKYSKFDVRYKGKYPKEMSDFHQILGVV